MIELSNIGKLTGWDKLDLRNAASDGVNFMIEHYYDILNIASHLNNGDVGAAFRDIMDKGLNELSMMCELDDKLVETEAQMQQPKNGLVTAFNKGFFGGE